MSDIKYIVLIKDEVKEANHANCEEVKYCDNLDEAYDWIQTYPKSIIFKPIKVELVEK